MNDTPLQATINQSIPSDITTHTLPHNKSTETSSDSDPDGLNPKSFRLIFFPSWLIRILSLCVFSSHACLFIVILFFVSGSLFNIIEGQGNPVSLGITILGTPAFLFLFYAAIKKGEAETLEDDQRYLNGR